MQALHDQIALLEQSFQQELSTSLNYKRVQELKVHFLGKKGPVQELLMLLRSFSAEEKKEAGKLINDLKERISSLLEEKGAFYLHKEEEERLISEKIDITLPGKKQYSGRYHPVLAMQDKMLSILMEMGFSVQLGPDIESDYYNFASLNYAPDHPARDMQDTFYLNDTDLLRTHNTAIQVRMMEQHAPPIRIVCPGNVYRNEEISARSHVFFHQIDMLYIDEKVSFADLFKTLEYFFERLLGDNIEVRVRPSFFPFVEPGLEVDISCLLCHKQGCTICKHSGWLEVAGAGMVHPEVLRSGGIDPEKYSGFAWGMGIERLVLILNQIPDLRLFTQNDLRFLSQF